jgi:hypothetical protein
MMPSIELRDLNDDGLPEVFVSFADMSNHTRTRVFSWNLNSIKDIGPYTNRENLDPVPSLSDWDIFDFDADGMKEIVDFGDGARVYKSTPDASYTLWRGFRFLAIPERNWGTDDFFTYDLAALGSTNMTIFTGDGPDITRRVTSGSVKLNGTQVVAPGQFGAELGTIQVPVGVNDESTLEVEIRGSLGRKMAVGLD